MIAEKIFRVRCWNCLNDYDAVEAVWCSCDPKQPSKLCPFCLHCFCSADDNYKRLFWEAAPQALRDEVSMLERSLDRLGEILIRNQKLRTPLLLQALQEQEKSGELLGKILVQNGWVTEEDIEDALKHQGYQPLVDPQGVEVTPTANQSDKDPQEILNHLMNLAAKKGASDLHIEPMPEEIAVKLRIDGLFYKVKPLDKEIQDPLLRKLQEVFGLNADEPELPQRGRASAKMQDRDYDLLVQTLPTRQGVSVTIKLIDRRYFLKNFTALGFKPAEQLQLMRALDQRSGLIMVTSPPYNGAMTTSYSLMDHLIKSDRKVVSIERRVQWEVPYVQQMEVNQEKGLDFQAALRSAANIRPDVVFLLELTDPAAANLACQLATTILVIATFPAFSAAESIYRFVELGVPMSLLMRGLSLVINQRLVRRICPSCQNSGIRPDPAQLANYGISDEEAAQLTLYRGEGCANCHRLGYRGRKGLYEIAVIDEQFKSRLSSQPTVSEIEAAAREGGMEGLRERCLHDVATGTTSLEEFVRWRM